MHLDGLPPGCYCCLEKLQPLMVYVVEVGKCLQVGKTPAIGLVARHIDRSMLHVSLKDYEILLQFGKEGPRSETAFRSRPELHLAGNPDIIVVRLRLEGGDGALRNFGQVVSGQHPIDRFLKNPVPCLAQDGLDVPVPLSVLVSERSQRIPLLAPAIRRSSRSVRMASAPW